MQEAIIKNKANVFISSNCNKIFAIIRESLKTMLLETGLCQVYVFEETNATSYDVVQSYMHQLGKCDLVIFLIDNSEPLGEGTLKEVKRAKELQKKCIYLFCNEFENKPTELQNELKNNLFEKYQVVEKLSHMAEEAYKSVVNDIMDIYSLYCAKEFDYIKHSDNESDSYDSDGIVVDNSYSQLKRDAFKEYDYTKTILNNDIIFQQEEPTKIKGFDFLSAEMLHVVIGNKKIADIDFIGLKKNILELHSGRIKSLIDNRLEAIYEYFGGNLEGSEIKLKEALQIAKDTKKIPVWITNDVAIDLRNIEISIGHIKNEIRFVTEGQTTLDASEELVYYPIIDRVTTTYYERIIKNIIEKQFDSPFTSHLGGVDYIINQVVEIFVAALCYGSLTHILNIREKLLAYLQNYCVQIRNHKMFVFTIKMLILCGKKKELNKFLRAYGEYTDNINDEDVVVWEKAIEGIGIRHLKMISSFMLFEFFGSYFEDKHFIQYYDKIKSEMDEWYKNPYANDEIVSGYLNSIEQNQYRIRQSEILDVAYSFFDKNLRRWYDDIFNLIRKTRLDKLANEDIEKCIFWIKHCVEDEDIKKSSHNLTGMIQNLRQHIGESRDLDELVKEHFPSFYEITYSLNVLVNGKEESWEHIQKHIESIKIQNDTQGAGGVYSGYAVNEYGTISNIISYNKVKLNVQQLKRLLDVVLGTLASEKQTYTAKTEALYLMLILKIYFPKIKCVEETIISIVENKNQYLRGKDIFLEKGYGEGTINFVYGLMQVLHENNINQFMELFSCLSKEELTTNITVLQMLTRLLECGYIKYMPENLKNILVYYLLETSMHLDRTMRFYSYVALIIIYKQNPTYSTLVLNRLSQAMDGEVYENKVGILSRIDEESSDLTKYIFEKGKADNHFWVRSIAKN